MKPLDFYGGGATFIVIAPGWRNGRRNRLKICRYIHAGSSPAPGIFSLTFKCAENDWKQVRNRKKLKKTGFFFADAQ